MQKQDRPVAFFDSGLGGISVLRETVRLLPQENYLYYGDSLHAPYGVKSEAQIQALSLAAAEHLVSAGAKAIVVACNTATSAAIGLLRQVYPDIPVIGTEPALKPAVEKYPGGRILVMATPMTIKQEKFQALKHQFDDRAQIIGLPCEGLMEFVERGELRGSAVEAYLTEKLAPYLREPVDGIVLGCTHYPFLTGAIRRIVGPEPEIMTAATASRCSSNGSLRKAVCCANAANRERRFLKIPSTSRRSSPSAGHCSGTGMNKSTRGV